MNEEKLFDNEEAASQVEGVEEKEKKQEYQTDIDKIKELEKLYNERLQELSQKEKELEPLIQLQQYLSENPEKAQKISQLLAGEDITTEEISSLTSETDEIKKLKAELESLKFLIKQQREDFQIKKEQERIIENLNKYKQQYTYFDTDMFFARMLAYPENYLDSLSDIEYQKLMDAVAKTVSIENEKKIKQYLENYLSKKKEISERTKSETTPSTTGSIQPKPEKITMDNAASIAKKLLEKFKL